MSKSYSYDAIENLDRSIQFKINQWLLKDNFERHSHIGFSEMVIILGGHGQHIINGVTFPLSKGDIYIISDNTEHEFIDIDNLDLFNIMFVPSNYNDTYEHIKQLTGYQALFVVQPLTRQLGQFAGMFHLNPNQYLTVLSLLKAIDHEYQEKSPGYGAIIKSKFSEMMVLLSRYYDTTNQTLNSGDHSLSLALSYIETNYQNDIRLADLSRISSLSPRQIQRLFKLYFKKSPIQYILDRRIDKAIEMLSGNADTPITLIALSCGFNDANYFSRIFHNKVGMSPSDFRS